ncbi:MAG: transcription-repair coupling factor [Lachnospiraceae bacterium]|nr:transcription-repair coupling factor [Lachnospiraceae bacterium]
MSIFTDPLKELASYEIIEERRKKTGGLIQLSGVLDAIKPLLVTGFSKKPYRLFITHEEVKAKEYIEEYRLFDKNVCFFPPRDILFYEADIRGNVLTEDRVEVLHRLHEAESLTVVTTFDALMDKLSAPAVFYGQIINIEKADTIDVEKLSKDLAAIGYERNFQVEAPGDFAIRGGIIDIYPLAEKTPIRIELWDDEVDSIRRFDAESQRSIEDIDSIKVYPANESVKVAEARELPATLLDYFKADETDIFIDEPARVIEKGKVVFEEYKESVIQRLEKGYIESKEADIINSVKKTADALKKYFLIMFSTLDKTASELKPTGIYNIEGKSIGAYNKSFDLLIKDLKRYKRNGYKTIIVSPSKTRAKRLAEDITNEGVTAVYTEDLTRSIKKKEVVVFYGKIRRGFELTQIGYALIAESDIFGTDHERKHKAKDKSGDYIREFADLKIGDYVVHENHGLGVYKGIEKVEMDGVTKDYIKLEYDKGGVLYVQANNLDVLQKYSGKDAKKVKLNTLGSKEWEKSKTRVRSAVKDIAADLVRLYAARQQVKGFEYGPDTVWQKEFEEAFPFEETPGQIDAIEAVKKDMESSRAMDRLICGDVGFGKTEVALRAAFKAVQDSKQVAYLVPTTILAEQHYNTFVQRMKDFPVRVELLSRFRSKKEQDQTIEALKKGEVDIVIGTHRLLSKDVNYKDLGLLIIDEEQRFGVAHKEKIKALKNRIDVLTLSATPIPRTLHMSLVGIRDMSVLDEAPVDRMPIQTYVMEYNDELVREAIKREIARGGQVYYVYNKVKGIRDVEDRLSALCPDARIAYAHGQMHEKDLEDIMYQFINGEIDVLVSTTIIETGLDIQNVNTIIIEDAENFGLSQLYQLRGRVGRSNKTAFAFLMYKRDKLLKEIAEKRLHAMREYTELGSGIRIAMKDLEIRGAGNILGADQSGHMEAVGYDMYCKMLNEAVRLLKGVTDVEDFETSIDIMTDAFIPSTYIPNEYQKLDMYKRIANVTTEHDKEEMIDEMVDRFGEPPKSVLTLLDVALLKARANKCFITDIKEKDMDIKFTMFKHAKIDVAKIPEMLSGFSGEFTVNTKVVPPVFIYNKEYNNKIKGKTNTEIIDEVLTALSDIVLE